MRIDELQYDLPPERIAQHPADRRDASRLFVVERATGELRHELFARLPELLPPGALLVFNDTRVLPARLRLRRRSGGRLEGLFLHEPQPGTWEMMMTGSRRLRTGELLTIESFDLAADGPPSPRQLRLISRREAGLWHAQPVPPGEAHAILTRYGRPPLPPYIKRPAPTEPEAQARESEPRAQARGNGGQGARGRQAFGDEAIQGRADSGPRGQRNKETRGQGETAARSDDALSDFERYQTVYARRPGAVAAPTAGLHFTPEMLEALAGRGFETAFVTLHVGAGTFAPIRCENLKDHPMHAEWYECPEATATTVNAARAQGRPIVAIGTTSVRVLETCADDAGRLRPGNGWTRLFIYPPYRFKSVDALLTNFHLPGSTLLAMVFAFAGRETMLAAYEEAIRREYRFYSYGDAMAVL